MSDETPTPDPLPNGAAAHVGATPEAARVPALNEALGELEAELDRLRTAAEQIEASRQAAASPRIVPWRLVRMKLESAW